jgi:hypothetical protein
VRRDSTGSHGWVEYPRGNKIYDVTHGINTVRISPDGKLIALLEEEMFGGGLQWLTIIDRSGAVRGSSKKKGAAQESSLAWTPDGREVWFTASEVGGHGTVYAMTLDGRERIAYTAMGSVRILDIAPGGRALLANDSFGYRMSLVDMNVVGERDLSWKDWSLPLALSGDGKIVAFGVGGRISANGRIPGFVRPTDGSPAVQLSEDGNPCAFSPDGNWLLTSSPAQSAGGTSSGWTIVPIGTGQARHIDVGHLANTSTFVRWLADDRIVYSGAEPGRPDRLFIQHIAGGPPEAFTPEGVYGPLIVSPDSTRVIVRNEKRQPSMYPVSGGAPTVVAGALPQEQPLAWSADAESIWVLSRATRPAQIFRIELRNGHRSFWREVPYSDPASLTFGLLRVVMSADGSKFVYGYLTRQSELYVAEGLR